QGAAARARVRDGARARSRAFRRGFVRGALVSREAGRRSASDLEREPARRSDDARDGSADLARWTDSGLRHSGGWKSAGRGPETLLGRRDGPDAARRLGLGVKSELVS